MPDTPVVGEPGARASGQHWPQAIDAMIAHAKEIDDALLRLLAEQCWDTLDTHWGSNQGCGSCNGEIERCSEWDRTQEIVLTWLMQRAGIV